MPNPISDSTRSFLAGISATSPELVATSERKAATWTADRFPVSLTLAELLDLIKAIKFVCASDGLSYEEAVGLRQVMDWIGLPESLRDHVEGFEVNGLAIEDVAEIFPPGTVKAKQLIDGAITIAMLDGYSDRERQATIALAERMGLRPEVVAAYEARIRLGNLIYTLPDEDIQKARLALRAALWALS